MFPLKNYLCKAEKRSMEQLLCYCAQIWIVPINKTISCWEVRVPSLLHRLARYDPDAGLSSLPLFAHIRVMYCRQWINLLVSPYALFPYDTSTSGSQWVWTDSSLPCDQGFIQVAFLERSWAFVSGQVLRVLRGRAGAWGSGPPVRAICMLAGRVFLQNCIIWFTFTFTNVHIHLLE
jgi:hypothetical protein